MFLFFDAREHDDAGCYGPDSLDLDEAEACIREGEEVAAGCVAGHHRLD